jgi:hypothetical protein
MDGAQEQPGEGNSPLLGHAMCANAPRTPASHVGQSPDEQRSSPDLGQVAELDPGAGRGRSFMSHDVPLGDLVFYGKSIILVLFDGGTSGLSVGGERRSGYRVPHRKKKKTGSFPGEAWTRLNSRPNPLHNIFNTGCIGSSTRRAGNIFANSLGDVQKPESFLTYFDMI